MMNLLQRPVRNKDYYRKLLAEKVLMNPYIPHKPTKKQAQFLLLEQKEALFGGSAGGGKSDALLMGALMYVDEPQYSALILRRSYSDLSLPGSLMDRAGEWLYSTDAKWRDTKKTWNFPSGATLTFGYLESPRDKYRYQSSEFQYIAFDELTQFEESQFLYLFSRLRKLKDSDIPLRIRSASNPGGIGHDFVKQRYLVEGKHYNRPFIPSKVEDNPYLNQEEYINSLKHLDPITRSQLLNGDWTARSSGGLFKREWFEIVSGPVNTNHNYIVKMVRFWDLAGTVPNDRNRDPDYTVGLKLGLDKQGTYYVLDVKRDRLSPKGVENLVRETALEDGVEVKIGMEEEPGSSGKALTDYYRRNVIPEFAFTSSRPTGSKEVRAGPVSSHAESENIKLVEGNYINAFLDELEGFPGAVSHDDQVDALSGSFSMLYNGGNKNVYGSSGRYDLYERDRNDRPSYQYFRRFLDD